MQRDMTLPNGISFHVPIKNERQLSLKLVRKFNDQNPTTPLVLPTITPQELALIPPPTAIPLSGRPSKSNANKQSKTLDFSKDPDFKDVASNNINNKQQSSPEKSRGLRAAWTKRNQAPEPTNEAQILLNVDIGKGQMLKSFFNLGDNISQIKDQIAEKISITAAAKPHLRLLSPEREVMDETKLLRDFKLKKMVQKFEEEIIMLIFFISLLFFFNRMLFDWQKLRIIKNNTPYLLLPRQFQSQSQTQQVIQRVQIILQPFCLLHHLSDRD